ncbi:copine-3-like isoform X5 [Bolinopsis microptera]|uniref:copine-3-like isoform X5 n=1 Tax=Bolinopsis microptera TaxID=2820187 RepID=UPI003079C32A
MDVLSDFQTPPSTKPKTKLGTTGAGKGFSKYIGDDEIAKGANAGMVILNFSCKKLRDRDVLSKSDPQILLYTSVKDRANYTLVGRTEKVKNNLNPVFGTGIEIPYIFERQTFCKVVVIDDDNEGLSNAADNLGEAEFTLGQAVSKKTLDLDLRHLRWGVKGLCIVSASHTTNTKELVTLQFEGGHLDRKDTFGKSDPYYEIYRITGGTEALVKRSEVVYNNLNPRWRQVEITGTQLCMGDENASIKIKVWDYDSTAAPDLIGVCTTTLAKMKKVKKEIVEFDLIHPKKQAKKKSYKNSGVLKVLQCTTVKTWSFLDYVTSGLQLNCMAAFDFTASNGHPNTPASLHHLNAQGVNQYTMAWTAIGQVLQDYDWDKQFPAYGFGGALPPNNQVSFEFALNANSQDPNCAGIQGVIQAYTTALQNVALSGPTNCAPIIRTATRYANACATTPHGGQGYLILLILTDGQFTDLQACVQAIQQAQTSPISIIIVGVGNADFSNMEYLDGDRTNTATRTRDIVQFVPFNKYCHSPSLLARELLAELPGQVEKYYTSRKIAPLGKKMH